MTNLKSLTFNGVKWYLIGDAATIVANFFIGIILARLLTPDDFGTVGVYGIFFALATIFINGGFSMSLVHKREIDDVDCSTAFWANVVAGVFFFAFFFVFAPWIADFFGIPLLTDIIRISAIGLPIGSLTVVQQTLFVKRVDFRMTSTIRFVSSAVAGVLCVILAYQGFGVWSLVIQGLISGLMTTLLLWWFSKWRPCFIFSRKSFNEMFSYGGKILGTRLLETLAGQASSFVIGKAFSPRDLGYYQKGAAYSRLLSSSLSQALFGVSFPVMAKIEDDATLVYVYRRYIKFTSMVIFFLMLLLCVLAHPLIIILYTEKWVISAVFMQIVIFGLMFDHIIGLNNNIFNVKGRSDILLRLQIIKSAVMLVLLFAALHLSVYWVCVAEAVYYQIAIVFCCHETKKLIGYGYLNQVRDLLPYLFLSAVAVLPSLLLTFTSLPNLAVVVIGTLSSTILYVLILLQKKDEVFIQYIWNNGRNPLRCFFSPKKQ